MTAAIDITAGQRKMLLALLRRYIPGVAVWAYGSRVKWTARPNSDLDLVAFTTPEQQPLVSELKEALAESDLPFLVDFHVWNEVPERFHEIIRKEYVLLQDVRQPEIGSAMVSGWPEVTLQYAFEINPRREAKRGTVTPFVPMDALPEHAREIARIDIREYTGSGTRFKNGDTLLARITPCLENGKTAYVSGLEGDTVAHGSTEYIVIAEKQNVSDGLFAYYLVRSPEFRSFAIGHMEGTSGRQRVPTEAIAKFQFDLPPLDEQKAIAHILGTLDDKIELNRRMNATLEAMARALFQSWFVDFDPVRAKLDCRQPTGLDAATAALFPSHFQETPLGHIPQGWTASTVGEGFDLTMGQSPPGDTYNEDGDGIPFYQGRTDFGFRFPTRRVYCTAPTRYAKPGDALVSVRAPVGDINMADEECCIGRGVAAVRHKSGAVSFTYHAMANLSPDFARFEAEGTVFGSINKQNFENLSFVIPPQEIVAAYEQIAKPIDDQIYTLEHQSRSLAALRDSLLPKLLSGELSVTETP